jgi:hypothetical protein
MVDPGDIPTCIQHPCPFDLGPSILPLAALPRRGLDNDDPCLIFMSMIHVLLDNNEMNKSNETCWNKNDVTEMNEPFENVPMVEW